MGNDKPCMNCGGKGTLQIREKDGVKIVTCPACGGSGRG